MEIARVVPEFLRNIKPNTVIHFGDSTLYTSLRTLAQGIPTVIIDNNREAFDSILSELQNKKLVFSFLSESRKQQEMYASIYQRVLSSPTRRLLLQSSYRSLWEKAKDNIHLLTYVNESIEDVGDEVGESAGVVDEITYHYPSRLENPRFKALELASLLLKPEGKFVITTENEDLMTNFILLGGKFVTKAGFKKRDGQNYVSAYDFAWGENGHFEIEIQNRNGELPAYIRQLKNGLVFKAISWLGLVK